MRMWMTPPEFMCSRHRSGEHNEIHKHLPGLIRGVSIAGRMAPVVQIQLNALRSRHDALAASLNHRSPLPDFPDLSKIYPEYYDLTVDLEHNANDLAGRCPACRQLMIDGGYMDESTNDKKGIERLLAPQRMRPVPVSGQMLGLQKGRLPGLFPEEKEIQYEDYKLLICHLAFRFSKKYVYVDYDEAISEGNLAFVEAVISYDPGRASFCTYLHSKVCKRLWSLCRQGDKGLRCQELPYNLEQPVSTERLAVFRKALTGLTEDALDVVSIALETPIDMVWMVRREMFKAPKATGQITQKRLTKYLRRARGWKFQRIWAAFDEIKQTLQTV